MRTFETGATRNIDDGKYDYEGFLSPLAIEGFATYMHRHRLQADGQLRSADNWKRGIPKTSYMKSAWRHFMHLWWAYSGYEMLDAETLENVTDLDAAYALWFNLQGYIHERLKEQRAGTA